MDSITVSVIVPVYNTESYLTRCIESILAQTLKNWELLLVDDGSTDASLVVCQRYARQDPRIRAFSQAHQGQSAARNLALEQMCGRYVVFLDSDDSLTPNALQVMLTAALSHGADLAICGKVMDTGLNLHRRMPYPAERVFEGEELLREYLSTANIESTVTAKLFTAEHFCYLRFPQMDMSEDACILPRLLGDARRAVYVPDALYCQTIRDGSLECSGFSPSYMTRITCEDQLWAYLESEHPQMLALANWRKVNAIASLMRKIVEEHLFSRYAGLYRELEEELFAQWETAESRGGSDGPSRIAALARNHPARFIWKYYFAGFYTGAKKWLKKLLRKAGGVKRNNKEKEHNSYGKK